MPEPTVAWVFRNFFSVSREYGFKVFAFIIGKILSTMPKVHVTGTVYAMNAQTGERLWTFMPPAWEKPACAGSTWEQPCLPDLWSAPTIGGDGTVYINWSAGGVTYALRDANGDGVISDGEISSYDAGSAATGPPAVAPGMLTVTTCRRQVTFLT